MALNEKGSWRVNSIYGVLATAEQIKYVLNNLEKLLIRGEFYYGGDTGYLDNVTYE